MPVGNPPVIDPNAPCKMAAKATVLIGPIVPFEGDLGAATYNAIGCCLTSFQDVSFSRSSVVEPGCVDFNCDPDAEVEECDAPADSEPGQMEESVLSVEVPHFPGTGTLTEYLESLQSCGEKHAFQICYANGAKRIIPCGWVRSYTPDEFTTAGGKPKATVEIVLCGEVAPFYV